MESSIEAKMRACEFNVGLLGLSGLQGSVVALGLKDVWRAQGS